jgi:predicted SAM-dependent methyltransferase
MGALGERAAVKLNLGSGPCPIDGYDNVDIKDGRLAYPLDCEDESVDEIRASHVLEHFSHTITGKVVKHWVDKLKPGGCLKIAVPDFEIIAKRYLAGEPVNVQGYTMGGHLDDDDKHGAIFDKECLTEVMVDAGLERIGRWESDQGDCSGISASLNLIGYKPAADIHEIGYVRACISSARFGPALHHRSAWQAFGLLKIPYDVSVGAFWHQIISESIERQLTDPNCQFVLTLDYDTLFTAEDVVELYRLMRAYPEADAICPLQSKRSSRDALFNICDENGKLKNTAYVSDFWNNLTRVTTGHFGLTMFRAETLRNHPRPWMVPRPDSDGRWSDNKVDADIDFWFRWRDAGRTLYLANKVVVGHLEEVVSWPGPDFSPIHQSWGEYCETGRPAEVNRC